MQANQPATTPGYDAAAAAAAQSAGGGARSAPLGTNAKSSSPPRSKRREKRAEWYRLQRESARIMRREGDYRGLDYPDNAHRVCKCRRVRTGLVQVLHDEQHQAAHYGGLVVCGSVWACPVCAVKVAERRREQIAQAFDYAYNRRRGKKMLMVTITFPHTRWQRLDRMLDQQKDALRRLRSGKVWQRIKSSVGFEALIRSLEITRGEDHGWHPHTHEAWLVDADCDPETLRETITRRWAASCHRAGLLQDPNDPDFWEHAIDVIDNASESDYLVDMADKYWGADRELAGGSTKRSAGRHPFDLLADSINGDRHAARLFRDYVTATKGRAQVFWSRGFKDEVGVEDQSDEELAEEDQEDADLLALLNHEQWRAVLREDARSTILDVAEADGWPGLAGWFADRGLPPPEQRPPDRATEALGRSAPG